MASKIQCSAAADIGARIEEDSLRDQIFFRNAEPFLATYEEFADGFRGQKRAYKPSDKDSRTLLVRPRNEKTHISASPTRRDLLQKCRNFPNKL